MWTLAKNHDASVHKPFIQRRTYWPTFLYKKNKKNKNVSKQHQIFLYITQNSDIHLFDINLQGYNSITQEK